ncbi:DUF397 domain-containing protein [Streptomyces sp. MBT65]|nr:DUF397 domain-containing protein [Streptomyces sp. MBT65]
MSSSNGSGCVEIPPTHHPHPRLQAHPEPPRVTLAPTAWTDFGAHVAE